MIIFPSIRFAICAGLVFSAFVCQSHAGDDPDAHWFHGYVLILTGNDLAKHELWPLALANYSAALAQFRSLSESHPDFHPELVDYRLADLKNRMAHANESMNSGDHDLAMHYEDVIETTREGATRRYALDFASSYRFLVRAQWQMQEMLDQSPETVVAALGSQRAWLDEITEKTREDLSREPGGALKVHDIEKDFAKSVSIALSDLPSFRSVEFKETETGMSSALFPEQLVLQVRGEWYYY